MAGNKMTSHFQVATLVASPCYPNSVVWSEENLLAIATGRLVTILNPSQLDGPRGLITIPSSHPFDIGLVDREELLAGCILPTSLSRDVRSFVRSIAWSQQGMAGNGGCLLAVCTTDGHVKLYRAPYCDFRSEWVELLDISEMLYHYVVSNAFDNLELGVAGISPERTVSIDDPLRDTSSNSVQEPQHRKAKQARKCTAGSDTIEQESSSEGSQDSYNEDICEESPEYVTRRVTVHPKCTLMPWAGVEEGASVEVLKVNGLLRFWVRGRIEQLEERKALVQFTGTSADEMQEEWVALDFDGNNGLQTSEEITVRHNNFLQKIRPCIYAGNLPKEITMATHIEGSEKVPAEGQLVEAWISNRWVEGSFVGFNSTGLLVNFPGEYGRISLDPDNVRMAPIWNGETKSWCVTVAELEMEEQKASQNGFVGSKSTIGREKNQCQEILLKSTDKATKKRARDVLPSVISAEQYAIRSGLLSSLVVAWSPTMKHSLDGDVSSFGLSYSSSAILAVGGKSGKVSLWRVFDPRYYTIEHCLKPPEARLIGLFQAHKSWATAVSWAVCTASVSDKMDVNSSSNKLLLATGSSDGSVKLWYGDAINLDQSHDDSPVPFSLLKEVVAVDSVPVSVLSLFVPSQSLDKVFIAIGKGSGQLSVWICYTSGRKCHKAGQFEAHDQVVTGLSWAFDGRCLYSCSQDNSVRSWIIHGSSLFPVPFPESSPGLALENSKNAVHLPSHVFDCCYGLALSPGNLVIAVSSLGVMHFIGGESAALARLNEYFWEKDMLRLYKDTRNGMLGPNYSTKFSPWLAFGCISPCYINEEVKRYERERVGNASTYWILFELLWRDYFRFISIKYGNSIFHLGGPRKVKEVKWSQDSTLFQCWRDGFTGYPLVDANMKELAATGFMSNRGRQIVCSFLVRDMGLDWRMGAEWFETCLLDYDPCSNYGNWTYGAGVGNDPREDRYFSIPKQAQNYDPDGEYVAHWIPEIAKLPKAMRHFPGNAYTAQVVPLKFPSSGKSYGHGKGHLENNRHDFSRHVTGKTGQSSRRDTRR